MKKIISLLLAVIIVVSSFAVCSVSVGATEEKSYKDQMIDAVLNNQSLWYSRSLSLFGMSTGYGHTEFLDLNFDGNLEFVVTYPGGTMGDIFRDVYYLKDGKLTKATGGDRDARKEIGYSGNVLKAYYDKSTGGFKLIGSSWVSGGSGLHATGNYTLKFSKGKLTVKYHSAKSTDYGTTTYYTGGKNWNYITSGSKISKSKYDSLNKSAKTNCVDAKLVTEPVSMEKWSSYYSSTKRALLEDSYDGFSMKKSLISKPVIKKFEGTSSGMKLTWKAVSGSKCYRVFRKTDSGWKTVGTTSKTYLTDKNAVPGENRYYTIRCMSKNGVYAVSSYDTTGRCVQYADTPVINGATYVKGGVNIDWEEAQGAVKYRVFVKYGSKSWTKLADTTDTTFTHKTGKNGRTYTYTVRCITASGKTYVSAYDKTGVTLKFKK